MRVESRIFIWVAVFLVLVAAAYGWWTSVAGTHGIEVIGTTCLVLSAGLCGIIGSYFAFVARRIDARPEDRDAEIAEGAGELGFFSPGSYWPLGLGLAATVTGLGVAFWQYWLIATGAVSLLLAIGGLLFEYYAGQNEEHGQYAGSRH